jgi:hypothetical protein
MGIDSVIFLCKAANHGFGSNPLNLCNLWIFNLQDLGLTPKSGDYSDSTDQDRVGTRRGLELTGAPILSVLFTATNFRQAPHR